MDIKLIQNNSMFKGLNSEQIQTFLDEGTSKVGRYSKGEVIRLIGQTTIFVGIVLSGRVYIENSDEKGNDVIFSYIDPGSQFGGSYAITGRPSMVNVVCGADCEILFIDLKRLRQNTGLSEIDAQVKGNLLLSLASKNLDLSRKIRTVSLKTIREKLTCCLKDESTVANSDEFDLVLNRQNLANYLNCDRCQLSKEMSKMKKQGLINYDKNHVRIFF